MSDTEQSSKRSVWNSPGLSVSLALVTAVLGGGGVAAGFHFVLGGQRAAPEAASADAGAKTEGGEQADSGAEPADTGADSSGEVEPDTEADACSAYAAMSEAFDPERSCAGGPGLDHERACVAAVLGQMPPWACRSEAERAWHVEAATQLSSGAAALVSEPSFDDKWASDQIFAAVLTSIGSLDAEAEGAAAVCEAAQAALSYACDRAECSASSNDPCAPGECLGELFGQAREQHDAACSIAFERACDQPSETPPDCRAVNKARRKYAKAHKLWSDFTTSESPAMLANADYAAARAAWRAGLAELAMAVEEAGRSPDVDVDELIDAHYLEDALPAIQAGLAVANTTYAGLQDLGVSGAGGRALNLQRLVDGLADCATRGCGNLYTKLNYSTSTYSRVVDPDRAEGWIVELKGVRMPAAELLARQAEQVEEG